VPLPAGGFSPAQAFLGRKDLFFLRDLHSEISPFVFKFLSSSQLNLPNLRIAFFVLPSCYLVPFVFKRFKMDKV
jgi:hypothetical protein